MDAPAPSAVKHFTPNAAHILRTTQVIQVQLSAMADQKASILMAASFLIFTITINQSARALPPLPLLVLGSFAFASAVLTVLAIVPKTRLPQGAPINMLFFGSYTQLPEDEYCDRVLEHLTDEEAMLRLVAHDVYGNGRVLATKKYRYLELAYRTFLVGLVVSAAVFVGQYLV